ncbi:MAG TPA: hypothetical protein VFD31_07090 [Thermoleophilaceae bacterium]|nr:hypothetical protein [Thermoleophilaceae bacterium]
MSQRVPVTRYTLVPRASETAASAVRVRRYSLARLGVSPRSALGEDRHERMERVASADRNGRPR